MNQMKTNQMARALLSDLLKILMLCLVLYLLILRADLETEINKSINEESSHIVDDSSDLPVMIGRTSNGVNVLQGEKNGVHEKN